MKKKLLMDEKYNLQILDQDLPRLQDREILVEVHYSGINYKDALAVCNKGRILRRLPLVPGIDYSGVVLESKSPSWTPGDLVVVNGCDTGELWDGGFASYAVAREGNLVPLPNDLSLKQAMILGTAGFTAALAIYRMEQNNQTPSMGPILVTGATGGVGSAAICLLKAKSYQVHALTGRAQHCEYLKSLGADEVLLSEDLRLGEKPLESPKFAGVIDNVGGEELSKLLAHTELWGNIACIGLAAGSSFSSSLMPFLLRGISLLGVSSNNTPIHLRKKLWDDLGKVSWNGKLESILKKEIPLQEIPEYSKAILERKFLGRCLVDMKA